MADAPRRRALWVALAAAGVVAIVVLSVLLALTLSRSAAPAGVSATPVPTPVATPAPTPSPDTATSEQDHRQYRAYVSAVVQGGAAVVASLGGLAGCRDSRTECENRLHDASDQVASFQDDLAANPAPPCLSSADAKLRDALTFQQKGLDAAQTGVQQQNRVRLAQGVLLTAAGVWRAGQAVVEGRQSNC